MHKSGHAGVSILLSSPFLVAFVAFELYAVAFIFLSLILLWSGLPDIDIYLQKYDTVNFSTYPVRHWEWIPMLKLTSKIMKFAGNYIMKVPKSYKIKKVKHRGITHSLWFSIAFGFAVSFLASCLLIAVILLDLYNGSRVYATAFEILKINPSYIIPLLFLIGFLSISFHCIGDVFTPSGIHFLTPRTDYGYTLDLFYSKDEVANRSALPIGIIMVSYSIFFGYSLGKINAVYLLGGFFGLLFFVITIWMILIKTKIGEYLYAFYDFIK